MLIVSEEFKDYRAFFKLTEDPFSLEPNSDFYYLSEKVNTFLVELYEQIRVNNAFAVVYGEVGVGKTALFNKILTDLSGVNNPPYILAIKSPNTELDARDFLILVLEKDGIATGDNITLHTMVETWLVKLIDRRDIIRLMIVDDAHCLSTKNSLELLKTFASLHIGKERLINIILLGEPSWEKVIIESEDIAQLVTLRFYLQPLSEKDVQNFIKLRLDKCGYSKEIGPQFSGSAYVAIYACTQGYPNKILKLLRSIFIELVQREERYVDTKVVLECFERHFHPLPMDRIRIARSLLEYEMKPESIEEIKKLPTKEFERWQRDVRSVEILLREYEKSE